MTYLEQVTKAVAQAPVLTVVGFPGVGKTFLGSTFNKTIFIQAENSKTVFEAMPEHLQPAFFPELPRANKKSGVKTSDVVMSQLRELAQPGHGFVTLFIDTVSSLNKMFEEEVVEFDETGGTTIGTAAGGFQNGYSLSASMNMCVRRACEHLRRSGMTIVFLSHAGIVKMKDNPDSDSDYKAYSLDMHEKSRGVYVNHSDAVIYLKNSEIVTGAEKNKKQQTTKFGKIFTTGDRVAITSSNGTMGYIDAKNRYNMPRQIDMPLGSNPLLQYIKIFNTTQEK